MSHVEFKKWSCRMSFVTYFPPVSHVESKKRQCHMSTRIFSPCCMSLSPMSHVEYKKWPCRPVDFRGQGPYFSHRQEYGDQLRAASSSGQLGAVESISPCGETALSFY